MKKLIIFLSVLGLMSSTHTVIPKESIEEPEDLNDDWKKPFLALEESNHNETTSFLIDDPQTFVDFDSDSQDELEDAPPLEPGELQTLELEDIIDNLPENISSEAKIQIEELFNEKLNEIITLETALLLLEKQNKKLETLLKNKD